MIGRDKTVVQGKTEVRWKTYVWIYKETIERLRKMVHMAISTGSGYLILRLRNNNSMKMARRRLRSGLAATNMWAIGKITRRRDSVSSIMRMATSTKEAGKRTKDTGKAHYGWQTAKTNWEGNTRVTGKKTERRAEAPCSSRQETDTTDFGLTTSHTAKAEWSMPMETSTKECGHSARGVATVS